MTADPYFILVSRFNWPHPIWAERSKQAYLDWVRGRVRLFEDFTAPSVRNGFGKLDRWLIMIDTRSINIREELTEITHGLPVQLVEYVGRNLVDAIRAAVSDLDFPARVMTCRLDTDDLMGAGLIQGYRKAKFSDKEARDGVVLSFPGGAVFAADENRFYYTSYPENPFICYVEDCDAADDLQTVYQAMHVDMIEKSPHARMLRGFGPQWASVVHGDNVANQSLMGAARFSFTETNELLKYFGLARRASAQ